MIDQLTHITILVRDIDEALKFYIEKFGFALHTDAVMPDGFRWVTVCPKGQKNMEFALMKAQTAEELERVGAQVGQQQSLGIFETKDCRATYQELKAKGVKFLGEPKEEPWGTGVGFEDLYGNKFYLNESR